MPHYITTHNNDGEATFSEKVPSDLHAIPLMGGSLNIVWTTWNYPTDISNERDIERYAKDRTEGLGIRICPEHGTAYSFVNLPPSAESILHRTMTIDVVVVLEGTVELHLDSGEKRVLKAGDSVVQRAGKHKWINVSEGDGWAKMFATSQPIVEPLEIGGKQLETDWGS